MSQSRIRKHVLAYVISGVNRLTTNVVDIWNPGLAIKFMMDVVRLLLNEVFV